MTKLSIVVPCYNEAENLEELWRRLDEVRRRAVGGSCEIIFVNDGSKDATWAKMITLAERDPCVVAVNMSRNHGHQLALSAGLAVSRGERVFVLDADLQDPPELLESMMALMDQGADVVYGKRLKRRGETWFKRVTAKIFYRLIGTLGDTFIPTDTGDFRLMSRRTVDILNKMPERSRFLRGMISWVGLKQVPLPYERHPRFSGKTHYSLRSMIHLALDGLTGFSIVPLRLASYLGVIIGIAAVIVLAYTLYVWLSGQTVQGWTSLMVVVLILGSVQLVSLGLFGEYIGRLYMEAKQRPLFIIDSIVRSEKTES